MLKKSLALLALLPALAAAQGPTDYEKGLTQALNTYDKASTAFYKGVGDATANASSTSDPDAIFQRLIPVYKTYREATDKTVDEVFDLTAPAPLKKIHRAVLVAKLRLLDGLDEQIAAFQSKDPGQIEAANKRLNLMSVLGVAELKKQVQAAGYDFDRFAKGNVLVKASTH